MQRPTTLKPSFSPPQPILVALFPGLNILPVRQPQCPPPGSSIILYKAPTAILHRTPRSRQLWIQTSTASQLSVKLWLKHIEAKSLAPFQCHQVFDQPSTLLLRAAPSVS
ncbi:hypothetical protein NP233_g7903 [Leucocoprinus birnbaumii]|uniref:Uncharacterized protein n=1 Tax=Leucocoprinus birnbaumii TaxID=56174 RepID=A0AAD5VTT6_9AGAR|nr:hypothetical protein NP233_g7903 [Leucocoprinus birnbaumii]